MCLDSNSWCIDFAGWLFRLLPVDLKTYFHVDIYLTGLDVQSFWRLGGVLGHPKHDVLEPWTNPSKPMGILTIPRSTEKSFDSDNVSPPVPASVTGTHGCCVMARCWSKGYYQTIGPGTWIMDRIALWSRTKRYQYPERLKVFKYLRYLCICFLQYWYLLCQ